MANRYPLIFDATDGNKIKELPSGDNLNLQNSSIVNAVDIQASGTLSVNTLTAETITGLATVATSGNYNDLVNKPPAFDGDYDSLSNKPIIFSGSYSDLSDKPIIATKLSQLINDTSFITNSTAALSTSVIVGLKDVAKTNLSTSLTDSNDLLRKADVVDGQLTIDVNNTGNLEGNVYSTVGNNIIVDGENQKVYAQYLDGTANINVVGDLIGSVFGDDSTLVVDGVNGIVNADVKGSVFGDDSTLLVDGVNGIVSGVFNGDVDKIGTFTVDAIGGITLTTTGALVVPTASNITLSSTVGTVINSGGNITVESFSGNLNLAASSGIISVNQSIIPDANEAYDIGSTTNRFRDLYLSGSTINLGSATISLNPQNGLIDLPIDASASLGLPPNVGINGFYGLSADFLEAGNCAIDPSASTDIAPNAELDALSGPIFAYSKIVFATPIPGYGAGIEYEYGNFPEITNDGKTPPTIVADIDGSGNLISLEITALGDATGAGEDLLFHPTGDPGSVNGGQVGLQDVDGPAPIVTAPGGVIPGYISLAELQTVVAASTSFADFQSRIAAL